MFKKINTFTVAFLLMFFLGTPFVAWSTGPMHETNGGGTIEGETTDPGDFEGETTSGLQNPLSGIDSFPALFEAVITGIVIPVGASVTALAIIYSGFLFATAQGNPEKLTRARQAFFWSVIGAVLLLGSWAITQAICSTMEQITGTVC